MATSIKTRGWQLPVIIGLLVIIALLINLFFFSKASASRAAKAEQQRQEAAAAQARQAAEELAQKQKADDEARQQAAKDAEAKRVRDAAEEHDRLLARYLNVGFTRKRGVPVIGIAVESETGTINPSISRALAQRLQTNDVQLLNSFFKPEFVADKYVGRIFSGDSGILDRLGLTNWLNAVLIGRQTLACAKNTELDNTITANLRLQLMVLPLGIARESQSWSFSANGVGFNESDARVQAEDRVVHQIATDATLSLGDFSRNK